jgi:signal transduction histidine kinase
VRVVSIRDITERKQSEAQLFDLAIEREKVMVLQRFIGDMSHDLRTPLSVIKTSIYLLERLAHDPVKFKQNLDMLQTQTDHLQHILDDLLSMSRLDKADTSDYRFRWLDVNAPIKESVDEQQTLALRKQVRLTFQATENLPTALIDYNEFKKMLKHLILNGLNYTPEGGSVTIKSRADDQNVIVEVCDTGEGITALDLPHIFDRFYRADRARGGESGGAGLGLTIARKIIEAHGGTIEAESKLGQGSMFRVSIPQVAAKDEIPTSILPPQSP